MTHEDCSEKKGEWEEFTWVFFFSPPNLSIGCLMWYWSVDKLTHSELSCQLYRLKKKKKKKLLNFWHFMVLFPLKTWNRLINVVLKQIKRKYFGD